MKQLRRLLSAVLATALLILSMSVRARAQGPLYCYMMYDFMNGNGGYVVESWYIGGGWWGNQYICQGQTGTIYCLG